MQYDFAAIEKKWQDNWEKTKPYRAVTGDKTRKKFYGLIEFPYPSAAGLHVGHPRPFTAIDVVTRKKRMEGYNVLFPIGSHRPPTLFGWNYPCLFPIAVFCRILQNLQTF